VNGVNGKLTRGLWEAVPFEESYGQAERPMLITRENGERHIRELASKDEA